jgi:pimeloyl-ACP methyl ester carboxylesterase
MRFILLFSLFFWCAGCTKYAAYLHLAPSDQRVRRAFKEATIQPEIGYIQSGDRRLRYISIGADTLPVTLLLHGSPSAAYRFRAWFRDSTIYTKTRLVAVDRPGYGRSGLGKAEISIARQAEILAPLLTKFAANQPVILLGKSYGGPVAARLAMNHPDKIRGLLLISASVAPKLEKTPRFTKKLVQPITRWMFPQALRVAAKEKLSHYQALCEIEPDWINITCPTYVLHGCADRLIYYSNAEYACQKLVNAPVTFIPFDNLRHNLFAMQTDTMKYYLLEAVKGCKACVKE